MVWALVVPGPGQGRGCARSGVATWPLPVGRVLPRPLAATITP